MFPFTSVNIPRGKMDYCKEHSFTKGELDSLKTNLLLWYEKNNRDLPWRKIARTETDINVRIYSVWVSEVMLQQTQVATVIDYYIKWMKKWPTVHDLASATLEEVMIMWSGLGYYNRGKRLWEGAKKVVQDLDGVLPTSFEGLLKLPGIGKYTAGAIASIALNEAVGAVDGNVIRVMSRLRVIGAPTDSKQTQDHIWSLANMAVPAGQAGDFNQSLMELGATICHPRSPDCCKCPVQELCMAYKQSKQKLNKGGINHFFKPVISRSDKEETLKLHNCSLCLPVDYKWDQSLGVSNYPMKKGTRSVPVEHYVCGVIVLNDSNNKRQLLLKKRPEKGLLAGQWECPSVFIKEEEKDSLDIMESYIREKLTEHHIICDQLTFKESVLHQFSHVHHHYHIWYGDITNDSNTTDLTWVSLEDISSYVLTRGVKKILNIAGLPVQSTGKRKADIYNPENDPKLLKTTFY